MRNSGQITIRKTHHTLFQILTFSVKLFSLAMIFWKKVSLLSKPQQICTINLINVVKGKWTLTLTRWLSRDGECDLLVPLYVIFIQLFKWKKSLPHDRQDWHKLTAESGIICNKSIVQIIPDMWLISTISRDDLSENQNVTRIWSSEIDKMIQNVDKVIPLTSVPFGDIQMTK